MKRTQEGGDLLLQGDHSRPASSREAPDSWAWRYCMLGQRDKAVQLFEEWLKEEPDHPVVAHLLAACTGRGVPARASDECVEIIFDDFADELRFEAGAPALSRPGTGRSDADGLGCRRPSRSLDVLDAGCGTGLCGPLVAPYARRLTGVDLSAGMLESGGGRERLRRAGER